MKGEATSEDVENKKTKSEAGGGGTEDVTAHSVRSTLYGARSFRAHRGPVSGPVHRTTTPPRHYTTPTYAYIKLVWQASRRADRRTGGGAGWVGNDRLESQRVAAILDCPLAGMLHYPPPLSAY